MKIYPPNFIPYDKTSPKPNTSKNATTFLEGHPELNNLLPTIQQIQQLQDDCLRIYPLFFKNCAVLHLKKEILTIAVPHAAMAAKLKNQLITLQTQLIQRGWQIEQIKLKIQIETSVPPPISEKNIALSQNALDSLSQLNNILQKQKNSPVQTALAKMIKRHSS